MGCVCIFEPRYESISSNFVGVVSLHGDYTFFLKTEQLPIDAASKFVYRMNKINSLVDDNLKNTLKYSNSWAAKKSLEVAPLCRWNDVGIAILVFVNEPIKCCDNATIAIVSLNFKLWMFAL